MKVSPLFPNFKERYFGWRYLLFQVIFLPQLLRLALGVLRITDTAVINFAYFALNFTVVIVCFRRFWQAALSHAGKRLPRILLTALGGLAVYWVLTWLMGMLIVRIDPSFANVNDQNIAGMTQSRYWLMAVGTTILVPVAEETLNRGAVFGSLRQRSPVAAYLVSTAVFSIIHIQGYFGIIPTRTLLLCFLQYLPAGVVLAAAYDLSGSIFAPIAIHCAVNAIAILAMR